MKNFAARYPVSGTSALKPKPEHVLCEASNIIEFPGRRTQSAAYADRVQVDRRSAQERGPLGCRRALASETVRDMLRGTVRGRTFDRVEPWQAVLVGVLFTAISFSSLFLGL